MVSYVTDEIYLLTVLKMPQNNYTIHHIADQEKMQAIGENSGNNLSTNIDKTVAYFRMQVEIPCIARLRIACRIPGHTNVRKEDAA